jgi:hypothetical protein
MKIAVCVPNYGLVKSRFAQCLADLVAHTMAARINYEGSVVKPRFMTLFAELGSVELKRSQLALKALDLATDFMLWIDADHTFPPDALLRLMGHGLPIVGCNYPMRTDGMSSALDIAGKRMVTSAEKAEAGDVEQAGAIGLGFCLMSTRVLEVIPRPWFLTTLTPEGGIACGHDVHFCNQARKGGIPVYVDHRLSWNSIGHIADRTLTIEGESANADAVLPAAGDQ